MALEKASISEFGNGIGLLYITGKDKSEWINTGIINDNEGADLIKRDALNRSPIGYPVNPQGSIKISAITVGGNVSAVNINGVKQIANPVAVVAAMEAQAAIDIAAEINSSTPASGYNYRASAIGDTIYLSPIGQVGAALNRHAITIVSTATATLVLSDILGGQTGNETYSQINGRRYWLNSDYDSTGCSGTTTAVQGDLTNALEITEYVIKRGLETALAEVSTSITADNKLESLDRTSALTHVKLTNPGANDLHYIPTDSVGLGDIIFLTGGGFAATLKDITTISNGNIKLTNQLDAIITDNTNFIALKAVIDATYGQIWTEMFRSNTALLDDSVVTSKILDANVTTAKIALLNITTALIADLNVTTGKINDLAVTTGKINDLAVTTAKIADLNVTTGKINDLAVTTGKINDLAVTTAKIALNSVTVDQIDTALQTEIFTVPVVFETGYFGQVKVELPYDCNVLKASAAVTKLIEATDDATIILKNNAGTAMTAGQIDLTAAAPIGNAFTASPTANNSFTANQVLILETSKVTSGGEALVTIHVIRT